YSLHSPNTIQRFAVMTPPIQPHLDIFQRNDIDKLYNLTRKLWRQGTFQYYLNNQQLLVLQCILDSSDSRLLFEKFMGSQISFKFVERAKLKSQDTDEANKKTQDNNETHGNSQPQQQQQQQQDISYTDSSIANGVESARQLALRIRYVLWDAAIDYYYDTEQDTMEEPYALFEDSEDEQVEELKANDDAAVATTGESKETEVKQGRAIAEDDDYDDEEDEEEKKKEEAQQQPDTAEPATQQTISHQTDDHGNIILEVPIVDNDEDLHQLDNKILMSNFNKIYHNFEHDKETLIKRQKLEENDKLLEENAEEEEEDDEVQETTKDGNPLPKKETAAKSKKDSQLSMNLGAANLSLKHLLRTIESNKSKLNLSDTELRQLITEVRKNRSKWASDDKIGQEELYEACEKVIIELRNHTEHSTAFLNKVSKRDAPNYYQIIKRPMDLNTILKKLKTFQYKSKSEFVEDVMLIWKNCLQFNTDPKHFLRAHAIAMQKKSLGLIHLIPDITVKDRKEVEEAFKDQDDGSATPAPSGKNTAGKGKKRSRNGEVLEKKELADAEEHKVKEEEKEQSVVPPSATTDAATKTTTTGDDVAMVDGSVLEDEEADGDSNEYLNVEDNDKDDMEMQTWKNLTAKTRADYCIARSMLFEQPETGTKPEEAEKQQTVKDGEPELKKQKVEHQQPFRLNPDAPALVRDKKNMREFEKFLGSYQSRKRTFKSEDSSLENDAEQEQQEQEDQSSATDKESKPYLIEYDINGGIPGIPYAGVSGLQLDQEEQKLIDQVMQTGLQPSCYSSSDSHGGLNKVINSNIELMQEIRRICYKISIIRQMQQQHHIHHSHLKPAPYNPIDDTVDLDPISRLPNREKHDKRVVFEVLRKRVAKLAMQTGFESAGGFAIDTLTQITGDYMDNLMRTIKTHLESPSVNRQQKRKNVLRLALLQNGITKFDELHGYVHENVIRQTGKLQELKGKLSGFLKSLLRPAVQDLNEGAFADNSEQFMNGDFSNELGDDFFGFKELGLDKELGVLGNTIPLHLLQSRLADQSQADTTGQPSRPAFEWYRPDPVQEDAIKLQIKTFQPFLAQVLHKNKLAQSKQFKTKREIADYMDSKTNLTLPEEEDYNKRTNKSKLPPNGKIIVTLKKKLSAISYYIPEDTELLQSEPVQTSQQPKATKPVNVKQEKKTKGKQQQQSNNFDEESDGGVGKLKNEVGSDTSLMF
ncbi:hypothetical protein WICPIJ_005606, partial [Wickerhamomyces pijperi]